MSIKFVLNNLINISTLDSVASEDTEFLKENLYNKCHSEPYRTTAKTSQYIRVNDGVNYPDIICIMNHNLTSGATITLKADNDPPNWGSPSYSQALSYNLQNIKYEFDQDYDWYGLEIDDAGNSNCPEIGELILGNVTALDNAFLYPYDEIKEYLRVLNVNPWGQRWYKKLAIKKSWGVDYQGVSDANLTAQVEALFDSIDGISPLVFIPDHTKADCWYVHILNDLSAKRNWKDNNAFTLQIEEQSRGIAILS